MSTVFANYKNSLIFLGTIASVAFMLTMLFGTDDEIPTSGAISASEAVARAQEKDDDENGFFGNSLTGNVTINGNTKMPHGTVIVYPPDSAKAIGYATIETNGSYFVPNLPPGDVKLVVTSKQPKGFKPDAKAKLSKYASRKPVRSQTEKPSVTVPSILGLNAKPRGRPNTKQLGDPTERRLFEKQAEEQLQKDEKTRAIKVYAQIDELYGSLLAPRKITTRIVAGENKYDIELNTHGEP